MKYYSEKLNKIFDTEKSLVEAEKAVEEKATKSKMLKQAANAHMNKCFKEMDKLFEILEDEALSDTDEGEILEELLHKCMSVLTRV